MKEVCKIRGSEISFEKTVKAEDTKNICQDIWDHPEKYSEYKEKSKDAYYRFLKYLWVEFPDGSQKRLVDMVK